jgi:hypothetical protein
MRHRVAVEQRLRKLLLYPGGATGTATENPPARRVAPAGRPQAIVWAVCGAGSVGRPPSTCRRNDSIIDKFHSGGVAYPGCEVWMPVRIGNPRGAVVALARLVLVDEGGDRAGVEQARLAQHRSQQRVTQVPVKRAAEPGGERDGEALLRSVEDFLRDMRLERGAQCSARPDVGHLHSRAGPDGALCASDA